jgi:hypothetical protein
MEEWKKQQNKYGKFHRSSFTRITLPDGRERHICPYCVNHVQGEPMEVCDCKSEMFIVESLLDGKEMTIDPSVIKAMENDLNYIETALYFPINPYHLHIIGQCCCYSEAHGKRDKRR